MAFYQTKGGAKKILYNGFDHTHGTTDPETGKETYYCSNRKKHSNCKGKLTWNEANQELHVAAGHNHAAAKDLADLEVELLKVG